MSVAKGAVGDHMEDGPVGGSGEGLAYLPLMTKVRLLYKVYIHSNTSVGQREKKRPNYNFSTNDSAMDLSNAALLGCCCSSADDSDSHHLSHIEDQ